jgi:hypothetical protein
MSKLREKNRGLPDFKRLSGVVWWPQEFPRTASMKVKRHELAAALRQEQDRGTIVPL